MYAICLHIDLSLTSSRTVDCIPSLLLVILSIESGSDDNALTAEDWKPLILDLNADDSDPLLRRRVMDI